MNPEVKIKISALDNSKAAFASVQKNVANIEKSTATFRSKLEELRPTFEKMALGGVAALTALAGGLTLSLRGAMEAETAQRRLAHVLQTSSNATDQHVAALVAQAKAMERIGVVSASNIMIMQEEAASFDLSARAISELTPAAADFAVALYGINPSAEQARQAMTGLGKALQGQLELLTKKGYILGEDTEAIIANGTEQERVAELIKVINSNYGDLNETMRQTTEGGVLGLRFALAELAETIGGTFTQSLTGVIGKIEPVITNITKWIEANPQLTKNIIVTTAAIAGLVAVVGTLGLVVAAFNPIAVMITGAIAGIGLIIYSVRNAFEYWQKLWGAFPEPVKVAIKMLLGPLGMLIDAIQWVKKVAVEFFGSSVKAQEATFGLQSSIAGLVDPMASQSMDVGEFSNLINALGTDAKEAADKLQRLRDEARGIFGTVESDEAAAKRQLAETIVEQEEGITEKKRELRKLERAEDTDANATRVRELRKTIEEETSALRSFAHLKSSISLEINEAERRAALSEFELKVEDIQRARALRLEAQLTRLTEIQAEIAAEQSKSNTIASVFAAGQAKMQDSIKVTSDLAVQEAERMKRAFASVFDKLPSYGSTSIRALTSSSVKKVNDAVITPKGDIISTHPDDWLIATKTPGELAKSGGGGNITINIAGTFMDDRAAAKRLSAEIMSSLQRNMLLT